jgi:hypothetical protein
VLELRESIARSRYVAPTFRSFSALPRRSVEVFAFSDQMAQFDAIPRAKSLPALGNVDTFTAAKTIAALVLVLASALMGRVVHNSRSAT